MENIAASGNELAWSSEQSTAGLDFSAVVPDFDGLTVLFGLHCYAGGHRVWGHNLPGTAQRTSAALTLPAIIGPPLVLCPLVLICGLSLRCPRLL